jgi:hypothetical protein
MKEINKNTAVIDFMNRTWELSCLRGKIYVARLT